MSALERKTRFELATFSLARRRSTPEPLPRYGAVYHATQNVGVSPLPDHLAPILLASGDRPTVPTSARALAMAGYGQRSLTGGGAVLATPTVNLKET